jgi:nucleotide-binding universal stress UspA family protein
VVIDYAKSIDADLISIMTEQDNNLSTGIIGPNAQQIVNHSPIPVLSFHSSNVGLTL